MEERIGLTLTEISHRIHTREVSASHAMEDVLEHVARIDGAVHAFVTVLRDQALQEAEAADHLLQAGQDMGPLHGVPVSVKDIFMTRGVRTTVGSKILSDWVPEEDATVVQRLRQAGAVVIGKTNLHEFAFGVTTENPHHGDTHNPWNLQHVPGGSSGGSAAAVASGMGYASLGTDTGGSVRIPASLCGITGLKPTYGRVSRHGVVPLSWSLDHVGPLTRTAEDAAHVLQVIAGHDPKDATSSRRPVPDYVAGLNDPIDTLTIGVPAEPFWEPIDPEVAQAVRDAIDALRERGVRVREVTFPRAEDLGGIQTPIIFAEAAAYHLRWMRERPDDYSPALLAGLRQGATIPAVDYVNAQRARTVLRAEVRTLFRQVDLLALPTTPIVAPRMGQAQETVKVGTGEIQVTRALTRNMSPFNTLGLPALSVPCGFNSQGLPIGFQLVGRPFEEETVLRAGNAYQQTTDWHTKRPPVGATP